MTESSQPDPSDLLAFARQFAKGTLLLDRYEVDAVVGHGAMGLVYRARQVTDGQTVAIKVEHLDPDQAFEGRFEREATLMARVHHPNVASLLDFGRLPDGGGVLVIEYIDGETMAQVLRRCGGSLLWREAVGMVLGVLDGLNAVHAAKILHRDIKPSNVMLERAGPRVKLVDFGVARKIAGERDGMPITAAGEVLGTLHYMAPEQLLGHPIDERADIYAVGVILYEALAGRLPFSTQSLKGTMEKTTGQPPKPIVPPEGRPRWPKSLERVIDKALAFSTTQRFASAAEFSTALRATLDESTTDERGALRASGTNLVELEPPTKPTLAAKEQLRRVVVIATRLPEGTLSNDAERAWIGETLQGYARPVELGPDTIGIVLNEGGTGESASIAAALVAALSARYGRLNVVQERVQVRAGWSIDVFSLVSVSTTLLAKLDGQR
ncbi:MAG: serine/threonine protein kinase [Myxococcales bacterium]|nr:serine/threonine protein kinase [Myxococcales bacterium]